MSAGNQQGGDRQERQLESELQLRPEDVGVRNENRRRSPAIVKTPNVSSVQRLVWRARTAAGSTALDDRRRG